MSQLVENPRHDEVRAQLLKARQRFEVDALDYKRTLKIAATGMTQREMASLLGMSQPAVAKALQRAQDVPEVIENFNAASPYEVCQRYAAGYITRNELVKQLVSWPYKPMPWANEYGEYEESLDGTWQDVVEAADNGLIDNSVYDEILNRVV